MDYFVVGSAFFERYRFNDAQFQAQEIYLDSHRRTSLVRRAAASVALAHPARFENSVFSFLCPFELLTFVLSKA
jgi:hypothetical protein